MHFGSVGGLRSPNLTPLTIFLYPQFCYLKKIILDMNNLFSKYVLLFYFSYLFSSRLLIVNC